MIFAVLHASLMPVFYKVRTTEYFVFLFSTKQVELQYIYTSVILWHSVAFYELRWTGADIETLL